jgi:sialic acid synthase SpsE
MDMDKRSFTVAGHSFLAAGRAYSPGGPPLVIAEIGTAHGGDIARAKELIDAARESGADCAKFQIVHAAEILHPATGFVSLPGGPVRLYDRFRELEVSIDFFAECSRHAADRGLLFLCTPFGLESAAELKSLSPAVAKVASPELNHLPLLAELARWGVPLILSSGVSRLADIERALELTEAAPERLLLHCVTSYPAPEEEYNLAVLATLSACFGVPVGVSDHSLDPVLVPALSLAFGSVAVEKHITLSRSGDGLDDPVALPPALFAEMTRELRSLAGKGRDAIVAKMEARYGKERVARTIGDGRKEIAPSERANYGRTNRSVHATRALRAGEIVGPADVALLRTEKVLNPGLDPAFLGLVVGARLARDVADGAGIVWDDLIQR